MNELIQALQNATLYPHPVDGFEVIQTHLSWIILTGKYAYKIKKPLNLGFQDFTTLEKRKYYCELEVTLNRRLAPDLYLDVLPITGSRDNPVLNGDGPVIEYAIKMHQFSQEKLLSNLVPTHSITPAIIKDLTNQLVVFHQQAQIADPQLPWGSKEEVIEPVLDNFHILKAHPAGKPYLKVLNQIESWAKTRFQMLENLISERKSQGFIRATHGDLHLGNIALMNDKPLIFDCIEFNESFRWTDVMNDVGFLAMDLDHFELTHLKQLFVNFYFERSNDYMGAALLTFYQPYRAMVRAKVSAFQMDQSSADDTLRDKLLQDLDSFIHLAQYYTHTPSPKLLLTYGPSGAGKSILSEQILLQTNGMLRLRSDTIRKHLFDHSTTQLYSAENTQKVYQHMCALAKDLIQYGFSVIVDATFLKQWQRNLFFNLSKETNTPLEILALEAAPERLAQRITQRQHLMQGASDADLNVLNQQMAEMQPLAPAEEANTTWISSHEIDALINMQEKS